MIQIKKIFYIIIVFLCLTTSGIGEIKDAIFATVGNKALTDSDIIGEIKTILIINNQAFSKEKKKELQALAVRRSIERLVKEIELEKYDTLQFNIQDVNKQLNNIAQKIGLDLDTLKEKFIANDVSFEKMKDGIKTELLWNSLIFQIYRDRLVINEDEIDEQLVELEKNKKADEYLIAEIVIKTTKTEDIDIEIKKTEQLIMDLGFNKAAMKVSVARTAVNGGELGWIGENSISKKYKSQIINTPLGEVSKAIVVPEGILFFQVIDKRKSTKEIDIDVVKNSLIDAEKNKILNMYSLSHFDTLKRQIAINYN